jgi:hypothetical protein
MRRRLRTGITTTPGGLFGRWLGRFERCNKHNKVWREGADFERFGGKACEECIMKARIAYPRRSSSKTK